MPLSSFQRSRWGAAIRSLLRAAAGRDPSRTEVDARTAAYLNSTRRRPLVGKAPASGPLFSADDYSPLSDQDPLGGPDGRDLSRAWAAVREDLDSVSEAVSESERRVDQSTAHLRARSSALLTQMNELALSVDALERQAQSPFFGGSGGVGAAGRGHRSWVNSAGTGLAYPQTTAVLLGGAIGIIPTLGRNLDAQGGGTLLTVRVAASSDPAMALDPLRRQWADTPFAAAPPAWVIPGPSWVDVDLSGGSASLLEIPLAQGTTLSSLSDGSGRDVPFRALSAAGTLWACPSSPIPSGRLRLTFTPPVGLAKGAGFQPGAVYGLRAHALSVGGAAGLVWGPFSTSSGHDLPSDSLFTVTLHDPVAVAPPGTGISWQVSTSSPDGPWAVVTPGAPLVLRVNGKDTIDLTSASPDSLSLGYYSYPVPGAGSLQGASLVAGVQQAQASAFSYDWSQERDPLHSPQQSDWDSPKGVVRTVAMGPGPSYLGQAGAAQSATLGQRLQAGSCLASYTDDRGQSLTAIVVTSTDPGNPHVLQPGYNYRFTWAFWSDAQSSLTSVPVGLFNPEGAVPGAKVLPYSVLLNGTLVQRGSSYFTDYTELSPAPAGYGAAISHYTPLGSSQGAGTVGTPPGASWPPFCGRMNLTLRPGWNEMTVLLYVPTDTAPLGRSAALVFGPNLLDDPAALYSAAGISQVRGWREPWTQMSEFDLRQNTPVAYKEVWAWTTQGGAPTSVLLNHNPAESETGFLSLDNTLSGSERAHRLSYVTDAGSPSLVVPGADPEGSRVWVSAVLTTADSSLTPVVRQFSLDVN